ncbi:MAG: GTPase HflX [Geminicoccaceae bacterium]|nr:GTPase HflX [Geminicoccaceae bacterium]
MPDTGSGKRDAAARLDEALSLARAIDLDIVGGELAPVRSPRPATLIGMGKVDEITALVDEREIDLVIIDAALSPVQQRNLERAFKSKVIDRTGLILEIFGERAATREGVLQVELAALSYQRSRLVRSWTHLERQRGGLGFIGGPGESQIELDRRRIDERMVFIRQELEDVRRTRGLHRKARKRVPYPVVALVGYTNAGKSTLFNRLTGAGVQAEDKLFATLDPTMRTLRLPSGKNVILSDTVGFITDLPTSLIAAFRATLEEVLEADLLLHVRDITHSETGEQAHDVVRVLDELGVDEQTRNRRMIELWNKADLLEGEHQQAIVTEAARHDEIRLASAVSGEGLDDVLTLIDARLARDDRTVTVRLAHDQGSILSWLHQQGRILSRTDDEDGSIVDISLNETALSQLEQKLGRRIG